jgi:hypothetical protein
MPVERSVQCGFDGTKLEENLSGLSETFSRLAFLEKRTEELTAERVDAEAAKAGTIEMTAGTWSLPEAVIDTTST